MKDIPIYDKTVSYAIEHNELEAYRASYKMNMACKAAISDAINRAYTDNSLNSQNGQRAFRFRKILTIGAETEMRLSELAPCIPDFWIYLLIR